MFLATVAGIGAAGGLVGRGFEMAVSETSVATLGQNDALAQGIQIGEQDPAIVGQDLGAEGNPQ